VLAASVIRAVSVLWASYIRFVLSDEQMNLVNTKYFARYPHPHIVAGKRIYAGEKQFGWNGRRVIRVALLIGILLLTPGENPFVWATEFEFERLLPRLNVPVSSHAICVRFGPRLWRSTGRLTLTLSTLYGTWRFATTKMATWLLSGMLRHVVW
jgi:hypothetical protein